MSHKTAADLIAEAKSRIREVGVREVAASLGTPDAPILLDVREPKETNLGRLPGALVLERGNLETKIEALIPQRDAKIVIYCASGNRSAFAADVMQQMGYTDVASMKEGWRGWVQIGAPVEA